MLLAQGSHAQSWEVFDMNTAGFPSNTVRAIAQDSVGGTWVGTDWGLCHFDGAAWEVFQTGTSGLPENDVRALACDAQGRIWIGMFTQGLVIKDGSNWTQYLPGASPMPSDQVRNITFDPSGNAWLSTTNGLARTDLTEWRIYNDTDTSYNNLEIPGVNIADVAVRDDGLVCIGTLNAGFTYLTDTLVLVYNTTQDGLPDNTALGVAVDGQGDRWAACPSGGLVRFSAGYNEGLFFQYTTMLSDIPSNALNDVVIDHLDRKIIATQNAGVGVLAADNASWTVYTNLNSGLPDDEVNCLSLSPDGILWIGTATGGVARFNPQDGLAERGGLRAPLVYPNPFHDQVVIHTGVGQGEGQWWLCDAVGQLVCQGLIPAIGVFALDLAYLAPGPYVLTLACPTGVTTARVVRR